MVLCDLEAAGECVFVGAILGPGAGVADAASVLNARQKGLGMDGLRGVQRSAVFEASLCHARMGQADRVDGDKDVTEGITRDVLQPVHVIGERASATRAAFALDRR